MHDDKTKRSLIFQGIYKNRVKNDRRFFENPAFYLDNEEIQSGKIQNIIYILNFHIPFSAVFLLFRSFSTLFLLFSISSRLQNILLPVQSKIEFDEETDIDETLNGLEQDDPYLVDVLKNYYLMSPASGPYRIDQQFLRSPLVDVIYLVHKSENNVT